MDFCYTRIFLFIKTIFATAKMLSLWKLGCYFPSNECDSYFRIPIMTREGIVFDVTPSAGKLTGNMKSFHEDVNRRKAMFPETGMSAKNVNILR